MKNTINKKLRIAGLAALLCTLPITGDSRYVRLEKSNSTEYNLKVDAITCAAPDRYKSLREFYNVDAITGSTSKSFK